METPTAVMAMLLVLLLLGVFFVIFSVREIKRNGIPRDDGQEVLDPKGVDDGMALVIYQPSKSRHVDEQARLIAQELYNNGYKVILDHPSIDLSNQVGEYDVIVLGSNVYVGQLSDLILDYAAILPDLTNKTLGLFSNGRLDATTEFDEVGRLVKGSPRVVTTKFVVGQEETYKKRVKKFVSKLIA